MMECGVELQGDGGDLHAGATEGVCGFGSIEEAEREMWLNSEQDDLLGVNEASMFYADFPPLPDFPCMSSSSSSSSTPALKTITCSTTTTSSSSSASSSSAASWAVLKSDVEEDNNEHKNNSIRYMQQQQQQQEQHHDPPPTLCSTASMEISQQYQIQQQQDQGGGGGGTMGECMDDVMDTFGYMELLEANAFYDTGSIFQNDENPLGEFAELQEPDPDHQVPLVDENLVSREIESVQNQTEEENNRNLHDEVFGVYCNNEEEIIQGRGENGGGGGDDEMSTVFLEWLKSNKDSVSANDLRSVKLKKSTIESAARRLGGGKEAMKQLLKLILEWVQTSHLQSKRRKENNNSNNAAAASNLTIPQFDQNTSFVPESNTNNCFNQTAPWISQQPPFGTDQASNLMVSSQPSFTQPMVGYVDPYTNCANTQNNPYQPSDQYPMQIESAHTWPPSQFNVAAHFGDNNSNNLLAPPQPAAFGYGNQYPYQFFHGPGDRLMRLGPSATKEARKKRMARQRRLLTHHNRHHQQNNQVGAEAHARLGSDNCTNVLAAPHANPANWMYWQGMTGGPASLAQMVPAEVQAGQQVVDRPAMQTQNCHQGRVAPDKRQGWKPEKNLRFLLQKVLKQSDVGSLGRIVLPKKEAETHLPELEARDGISITMEDIGTSRVWNMRYRYWPNNKSRMYLLENTGDFVRANGLQEGDFIVIYSDVKCGKFMIRGVKVRQQGAKAESKKGTGKSQKNQHGINNASPNNGTPKKKNWIIVN